MFKKTLIFLGFLGLLFGAVEAHAADHGGSGSGDPKEPTPEFEYLDVAPLIFPVVTARGLTQQVGIAVSLEIPFGTKADIKPYLPKLVGAYLEDLYGPVGSGKLTVEGGAIDAQAVKARLTAVTEKIMGPDKVHSVLLQVVQQRERKTLP